MPLALDLASDLEEAPHARRERSRRVGRPFSSRSGPGMEPIRAKKEARLGLSPDFTGALRFMPSARAEALPLAFNPPLGFLPALRCHAGVSATSGPHVVDQIRVRTACLFGRTHCGSFLRRTQRLWLSQTLWSLFVPNFFLHFFFFNIVVFILTSVTRPPYCLAYSLAADIPALL